MRALASEYVLSKKLAWARTTSRNEESRLNAHADRVLQPPAEVYLDLMKTMKPYSVKTTMSRLSLFYQYLLDNDKIPLAKNPWKQFMESHASLFKHVYKTERLTVDYAEAARRIDTMPDQHNKMASLQLLRGGLRYCELKTFDGEQVIGKGRKVRATFFEGELKAFRFHGSYSSLYKSLKALGLKPHSLRKLCATEFSRQPGVTDADMCEFFGWESIETSGKYRQPMKRAHMSRLIKNVVDQVKPKVEAT